MKNERLNKLIKISLLGAIGFVLMLFELPLPIFPSFLKIDISDFPALLGSLAIGPAAGIFIELLKNILHLLKSSTAGIGEFANFIVGGAYVFTAGAIYSVKKDRKHALYGITAGSVVMIIAAALSNLFILLPLYEKVLGFPIAAVVGEASKVNKSITDVNSFIVMSIVPFNLLKAVVVSIISFFSYKKLSPILHK